MRYYKGSISIYFVFAITLIISVILSVTELARYNCQRLYLQIATDASIDSMLSLYYRKLYDYYNIYGVEYKNDDLLTEEYLSYIKPYFVDINTGKKIENWYNAYIDTTHIFLTHKELSSETFFEKEILEYMRYAIIGKTIDYFGKEISIADENDTGKLLDVARDVFEETKKSEIYNEIHKRYFDFTNNIKKLEQNIRKVSTSIRTVNTHIQGIRSMPTSGNLSNARTCKTKITSIKNAFLDLKETLNELQVEMAEFREDIYIKKAIYEQDRISGAYDFTEEIIEFVEDEFGRFLSMVCIGSEMDVEVEHKKGEINTFSNQFDYIVSEVDNYVNELADIEREISEARREDDTDTVKELKQDRRFIEDDFTDYLKEIKEDIKSIFISDINIRVSDTASENEENLLRKLIDYKDSLLLGLVFDEEEQSSFLRESRHYKSHSLLSDNQHISLAKILLSEYALDKFNYYNKEKNVENTKSGSQVYEVERLIVGKNSDYDNIESTITKIFNIRLAMNVLCIYKNSEMRNLARTFTYTVFGGFSRLLAEVMFLISITAWGAAQSIVDIRRLVKNQKVRFMHESDTWGVHIDSLMDFARNLSHEGGESDDNGLVFSYKDYLRLLLIIEKQDIINERMASIMEYNIKTTQDTFDFEKLIAAFDVKNEYICKHFFTNFLLVGAKDVVIKDEYKIETSGYKSFIR